MPREGGRPKEINIPSSRPPPAPDRPAIEPPKGKEVRTEARARPEMVEDEETRVIKRGGKIVRTPVKTTPEPQKERVKLTINNAFDQEQRERSLASLKRKRERERLKAMGVQQPRDKIVREVIIPEAITIQELSNRMAERAVDLIKLMMKQGAMHKITDVIDADTAELIVQEFGHTAKRVSESDVETGFIGAKDDDLNLKDRAPVVTIMGHVDHGKTSLLDAIRQTNVVSGEAGGITQHIGAYQVTLPSGGKITFIDTPGHAAFTAMRARGAKVTDIVVLVVAADDGVMPQTVEAINHAKAAGVPMIVAINKIDKPQADPTRVKTDLLSQEVVVESMGGDTLEVPVSALKRTNLDKLLEAIHLQAEVLDLKANPDRTAEGIVIEAKLERGRGPVGTALVQRGTLHVGDIVVAGTAWGRVRALINDKGQNIAEAGPSVPVEILGFDSAPEAGDQVAVVENEARAREITDYRTRKRRETLGAAGSKSTLEQMMQQLKEAGKKDFNLLIKGDVQGSVEAIMGALKKLGTDEVEARIVHSGVGGITESDIALASASKAVVIGFNVRANTQAKQAADTTGHRNPLLQHHLRSARRREGGHVRPPCANHPRSLPRQRGSAAGVQHLQGRQGRRLPGHRRQGHARRQGASHPRQRGDPRGFALGAQALQGRRQGSAGRPGMRHVLRQLSGPACRRRHRMLQRRDGHPLSLIPFTGPGSRTSRGSGPQLFLIPYKDARGSIPPRKRNVPQEIEL